MAAPSHTTTANRYLALARDFARDFPDYADKNGQPNLLHIANAAKACGYASIVDAKLDEIFSALRKRANGNQAAAAATEPLPEGAEWCQWCRDFPAAPGQPCERCRTLGASPEARKADQPITPAAAFQPAANDWHQLLTILGAQTAALARLADAVETIARYSAPAAPDYKRKFAEYSNFDWAAIGAEIIERDEHGPTAVRWNGNQFVRRYGKGKFGKAVWFSRSTGKDDAGNNLYARLVTFKDFSEAQPIA